MVDPLVLSKPCPHCKAKSSVRITKNLLHCTACSFSLAFQCPICNSPIPEQAFFVEDNEDKFKCPSCQSTVANRKIQNLLEIGLVVDQEIRCDICNGPTIHRPDMNLSHRCFFYPNCSGQADLFAEEKKAYTFLDFETTGLEPGKDAIIEIGALKIDEQGYEYVLQQFVKPPFPISQRISDFTGITNDMVEDAPDIRSAISDLKDFIGNSVIVAHNADFDIPWLLTTYIQNELAIEDQDVLCTLKWARAIEEPRCSLSALTKKYEIGHQNAHRALADAAATKELFFIFENQKKAEKSPYPFLSYEKEVRSRLEKLLAQA